MKKFIFFILIIFLIATRAFASVKINEIMYDVEGSDSGREWIEIYNDGGEAVDLSKWKLFEANTNHGLTSYQGNSTLSAGGFALIANNPAKFLVDWPSFADAIFKSSFSLSNTGESLALKDENLNIIDTADYSSSLGATGDGKSLQLIDNKFQPSDPTPGKVNILAVSINNNEPVVENNSTSTEDTTTTTNTTTTQAVPDPVYKLEIVAPEKVLAGMSFTVGLKASYGDKNITSGKFYWNFGNGETKESAKNEPFNYTYSIAGDYLIVLDYFKNVSDQDPVSTTRFKIKVLPIPAVAPIVEIPKENVPTIVEQKPNQPIKQVVVKKVVKKSEVASDVEVKVPDQTANVSDSTESKPSLSIWLIALSGFILISLFSIFLFKKSPKPQTQNVSKEAEDFEVN